MASNVKGFVSLIVIIEITALGVDLKSREIDESNPSRYFHQFLWTTLLIEFSYQNSTYDYVCRYD